MTKAVLKKKKKQIQSQKDKYLELEEFMKKNPKISPGKIKTYFHNRFSLQQIYSRRYLLKKPKWKHQKVIKEQVQLEE